MTEEIQKSTIDQRGPAMHVLTSFMNKLMKVSDNEVNLVNYDLKAQASGC